MLLCELVTEYRTLDLIHKTIIAMRAGNIFGRRLIRMAD